jgi:hypothetical protein
MKNQVHVYYGKMVAYNTNITVFPMGLSAFQM